MEFKMGRFLEILRDIHWERLLLNNLELREALLMASQMVMLMENLRSV